MEHSPLRWDDRRSGQEVVLVRTETSRLRRSNKPTNAQTADGAALLRWVCGSLPCCKGAFLPNQIPSSASRRTLRRDAVLSTAARTAAASQKPDLTERHHEMVSGIRSTTSEEDYERKRTALRAEIGRHKFRSNPTSARYVNSWSPASADLYHATGAAQFCAYRHEPVMLRPAHLQSGFVHAASLRIRASVLPRRKSSEASRCIGSEEGSRARSQKLTELAKNDRSAGPVYGSALHAVLPRRVFRHQASTKNLVGERIAALPRNGVCINSP
ncbi:II DNA helicase [Pseudozyma hubeiensis SY62]|uniref:II DNA helicase n=1 Tax=Pseudozyma hubeiensis (strain SY62) TaxID=1305764 RepID=R9PBH1_PSEHS|nr:II DNA helicase [Pseudozyma hubeiensis SY62]GAC98753.1 II DNA helicase [Pseudozyma hubeiensis SY62]